MTRSPRTADLVPPPPLVHLVPASRLSRDAEGGHEVSVRPAPDVLGRVAGFLDIEKLEGLALTGRLAPGEGGVWIFRGQLTATVVQSCVVTLDPVRSVIDTAVRRTYVPGPLPTHARELELDEDDLDPPEPFSDAIDLGQLAVETLALSLEPWPRIEGAAVEQANPGAPGLKALEERKPEAFRALAELKARLSRGKS